MASSTRDQDENLIDGFVGGQAFALRIVDGWIDVVLRREYHSLAQEWEDLRQEVRTRVFRNLSRGAFRGDSDLRTYVHQITKNVCVDQLRGMYKDADGLAKRPVPEAVPIQETAQRLDARDLLERLLLGLSARDRRLVYLVHLERLSYSEVARELGISEGAVKLRMFRCRRRILKRRGRLLRQSDHDGGKA